MFSDSFKYYKSKSVTPNLAEVVDIGLLPSDKVVTSLAANYLLPEWTLFTFSQHPGLIIVRNPFTAQGQRYWSVRCLRDFAKAPPNRTNLMAHPDHYSPAVISDWWQALQEPALSGDERRRLKRAMRWTTLGYNFDWDSKVYSETQRSAMPADLVRLCKLFADALHLGPFEAEAAIVNYYSVGHTLAPHTDHSELNQTAPLFSFSFGQTAVFLIGGKTKTEQPTPIYLRSGDVLIMSGDVRLCYHAVPLIMVEATTRRAQPWNSGGDDYDDHRAAAQATPTSDGALDERLLYAQVATDDFWLPYGEYLQDSRINLNVRQVHQNSSSTVQLPGS